MKVFVIGAGVAGLAFASFAEGLDVTVIDSNEEAGRKLLATGNGRCNFTSLNYSKDFYQGENPDFPTYALDYFRNSDLIEYFKKLGIDSKSLPSGRTYPATMSARSVRDILYLSAKDKAKFIFNEKITGIDLEKKLIESDKNKYKYDILVLASGGITLKNSGSDGSVLEIIKDRQKITDLTYGITNYKTREKLSKKAKGTRVTAKASLYLGDKLIKESTDDVIFQSYGLTGTAILDLSNEMSISLKKNQKPMISLDLFPSYEREELRIRIKDLAETFPQRTIGEILLGLINDRLIDDIVKKARISIDKSAKDLSDKDMDMLIKVLKQMRFTVKDIHDKTNAQVTIGGVDTKFVDDRTMRSKIYQDLYFCGEILDVSGSCGGYNIQWAFSSAKLACDKIRSINV
ncbi:MAG: aminoacetone oxidase family FAD-binding enzyme [Anaerococcus sp.]|uniref:aminoacetone oxidase family FAD-binding enzyme n=1 Tax=Anaerococcus sp. TaxID=1872515 RepID=UPI0026300789|nr:aminoacetone oxidase family FAD-binding enzyme [Anaerococcus sp.]MCI5972486.1 aminoacetone oxidase family FAD-binding enzyme [Anaerococcus sp.]MDY2928612.1 aminoacetone oxidase family FAD-binding enzyme [Anaerococcus sp.]